MALLNKTTYKGLAAPNAYAAIQSLYTAKTEGGYETTAYIRVFDSDKKENILYCEEEKIEGEKTIGELYKEIKKTDKWKKWKDA